MVRATLFRYFEALKVACCYYWNRSFLWSELVLASQYLWTHPYRLGKECMKKLGGSAEYLYGETPLTTWEKIVRKSGITSRDIVYDLGCGTARPLNWLITFVKCRAVGIDLNHALIKRAQCVKRYAHLHHLTLIESNYFSADLNHATVIYLFGTCMPDERVLELIPKLEALSPGTKVISVSFPLIEFSTHFAVTQEWVGRFPWGKAPIYLNVKRHRDAEQLSVPSCRAL